MKTRKEIEAEEDTKIVDHLQYLLKLWEDTGAAFGDVSYAERGKHMPDPEPFDHYPSMGIVHWLN